MLSRPDSGGGGQAGGLGKVPASSGYSAPFNGISTFSKQSKSVQKGTFFSKPNQTHHSHKCLKPKKQTVIIACSLCSSINNVVSRTPCDTAAVLRLSIQLASQLHFHVVCCMVASSVLVACQ